MGGRIRPVTLLEDGRHQGGLDLIWEDAMLKSSSQNSCQGAGQHMEFGDTAMHTSNLLVGIPEQL